MKRLCLVVLILQVLDQLQDVCSQDDTMEELRHCRDLGGKCRPFFFKCTRNELLDSECPEDHKCCKRRPGEAVPDYF